MLTNRMIPGMTRVFYLTPISPGMGQRQLMHSRTQTTREAVRTDFRSIQPSGKNRMRRKKIAFTTFAVIASVTLAGCGGGGGSSSDNHGGGDSNSPPTAVLAL